MIKILNISLEAQYNIYEYKIEMIQYVVAKFGKICIYE